jgi:hypothetical protein
MKFLIAFLLLWSSPAIAGLTDYSVRAVPSIARPALGVSYKDPVFGSTLIRRTDPSLFGVSSIGGAIEYSRFATISADNRFVVLTVLGGPNAGTWEIRDLATRALKYRLVPQGDPEFSWHPSDPTSLFYRSGNQIRVFNTISGQSDVLMAFPQYDSIGTNEEGRPSDAWDFYAFLGKRGGVTDLVVVDLIAKKVLGIKQNVGEADWVSMSPSGKYVVVMWADGQGTQVYTRELIPIRKLFSDYAHSDFAYDVQGNEVLVYEATQSKQLDELGCPNAPNGTPIASVRLSDAKKTILLGDCQNSAWAAVIAGAFRGWNWFTPHFSGIASRAKPGWVLVSTYSDAGTQQQPFAQEVFLLALDGSGRVQRLAHHHSTPYYETDGSKKYWDEPHATSSWDSSLILLTSNWGQDNRYDIYTISTGIIPVPPPPPPPPTTTVYEFVVPGHGTIRFTINPKAK